MLPCSFGDGVELDACKPSALVSSSPFFFFFPLHHLSPLPARAITAMSANAHQYCWKKDFSATGVWAISLPSASSITGFRILSLGAGPGIGCTMTTFRSVAGAFGFDGGGGVTLSAEKDAAKTEPPSRRWRVTVCRYEGLNVDRLVRVVEPSTASVEMLKRGCDVPVSAVVLLAAGGEYDNNLVSRLDTL